jgi:hypothetical protein
MRKPRPPRPPRNWTRRCGLCSAAFTDTTTNRYCSDVCRCTARLVRGDRMYRPTRADMPKVKTCKFCDIRITGLNRYCSLWCSEAAQGRRVLECVVRTGACRRCGAAYCVPASTAEGFCSSRCNKAQRHKREKARRRSHRRAGEDFTLREIAERDGWRCHLCGDRVPDRQYEARDKDPTIDHLVPISHGGPHTRDNVALAHNRCNWERSDKPIEFQLRLIA